MFEARTEGWPAGLQLAALSLKGHRDPAALVEDLGATQRHTLDFLIEEVVERQPARVQQFLLATSILEHLTARLCDDLLDLLANRLMRAAPACVPELHHRASAWYERQGLVAEAVDHAFAARDLDRVATLLSAHGEALLMRGETETLLSRLATLSESTFREHPLLDVWYGAALLFGGRPAGEVRLHLARAGAGTPAPDVAGSAEAIAAILALLQGDPVGAVTTSQQALELLPEGGGLMRLLTRSNLGVAQMVTGDLKGAVATYERLLASSAPGFPVAMVIGPLANLGGLAMIRGELTQAV